MTLCDVTLHDITLCCIIHNVRTRFKDQAAWCNRAVAIIYVTKARN